MKSGKKKQYNDSMYGIPTAECPFCECRWFSIKAMFDPDEYTVAMYALDMECMACGALLTAPTPLDLPENRDADL
jgi:hypothetical protein